MPAGNLYCPKIKNVPNMNMVFRVTSAKARLLKPTKAGLGNGKNKSNYLENADKSTWPAMTKINL